MKHLSLKEFAATLNRAAQHYLKTRGVEATDIYRMQVESCPVHGTGCARVTYGVLRDHFSLHRADPSAVAVELLQTMLPSVSAASADEENGTLTGAIDIDVVAFEGRATIPFPGEYAS